MIFGTPATAPRLGPTRMPVLGPAGVDGIWGGALSHMGSRAAPVNDGDAGNEMWRGRARWLWIGAVPCAAPYEKVI